MTPRRRRPTTRRLARSLPAEPLRGPASSDGVACIAAPPGPFRRAPAAEYTIAAALFGVGIHVSGRPEFVLIAGGGVIGALAFVTKGPLAAVKLLPKRLHLSLDLVVAALFAISPLLYLHDLQIIPIILCEAVAVLLVRMSFTTEIVPRPHPERTGPPSRAARLGALMSHGAARTQTSRMPPATAAPPAAAAPPATGAARQPANTTASVPSGTAATPQTGNAADAVAGVAVDRRLGRRGGGREGPQLGRSLLGRPRSRQSDGSRTANRARGEGGEVRLGWVAANSTWVYNSTRLGRVASLAPARRPWLMSRSWGPRCPAG